MNAKKLTDKNYSNSIENTNNPIFIDFYSPSCGPCQTLLSFIDDLSDFAFEKDVEVFKCDISKNPKIVNKYQIRSVPFTLIINKDKKIKNPEIGLKDKSYYFNLIEKASPNKVSLINKIFGIFK